MSDESALPPEPSDEFAEAMAYQMFWGKTGDRDLDHAREQFAKLCNNVRNRLLRQGYEPRRCMEEVQGRQCRNYADLGSMFWGIVGFCNAHRSPNWEIVADAMRLERTQRQRHDLAVEEASRTAAREATLKSAECGVYVIYNVDRKRAKVGMTTRKKARIASLRAQCPGETIELDCWFPVADDSTASRLERHIQHAVRRHRIGKGEWFRARNRDAFKAKVAAALTSFDSDD
jgi:hypothetical protein